MTETPNEYQQIIATLLNAHGRLDLIKPRVWGTSYFSPLRDDYLNIDTDVELIALLDRVHAEYDLIVQPEVLLGSGSDTQESASVTIGTNNLFANNSETIPLVTADVYIDKLREIAESDPSDDIYFYENLPNPELNPPYFSHLDMTPVDAYDPEAIKNRANEVIGESIANDVRTRINDAASNDGIIYLAMLDAYPPSFINGTALSVDGSALTGMELLDAQNAFLSEAYDTYIAAEAVADGGGYFAVMDLLNVEFEKDLDGQEQKVISRYTHGILTAIEALESYNSNISQGASLPELRIYPVDKDLTSSANYGIIPEEISDQVMAWSLSLVSANRNRFTEFIYHEYTEFINQLAVNIPAFSSSGNYLEHKDRDAFQGEGVVVVGGGSCLANIIATGVIDDDTRLALTGLDPDTDCNMVYAGTSLSTPHVAGTWLAMMVQEELGTATAQAIDAPLPTPAVEGATPNRGMV